MTVDPATATRVLDSLDSAALLLAGRRQDLADALHEARNLLVENWMAAQALTQRLDALEARVATLSKLHPTKDG